MVKRAFFLVLVLALATVVRCGGDSGGTESDTPNNDEAVTDVPDDSNLEKDETPDPDTGCVVACGAKECGPSNCLDQTCGTCTAPEECTAAGMCEEPACVKECGDKVCGASNCPDQTCGTCQYGTCAADQKSCECTPDCTDKVCGPDGCGGTCAPGCTGEEICKADGTCGGVEFGKATLFNGLYIPELPDATGAEAVDFPNLAGAVCLDISGDGNPDNGLGALLSTLAGFGVDANGEIKNLFAEGETNILLDLGDDPEAAPFTLNGYMGKPGAAAGEYLVDPTSFVDGQPMIHFEGAEIDGGKMELGPITFPLGALLAGFLAEAGIPPLDITLDKVKLVGTVDGAIDDMGVAFKDGTLAGAIFKADLDKALYLARKWCAEDPEAPADICGYLQMADMSLIETFLTWDLEIENCGKKLQVYDAADPMIVVGEEDNCQAVSACIFWGSAKAKITGLAPAEE